MNSWELLKDRDNGKVYVLGHRGSPLIERENTLQSFCRAIDEGADGVELDVHPTLDDHLVVSHDNSLKRVFGIDKKIEDITFEELRGIAPEVPLLYEVFDTLGSVWYDIEIKADKPIGFRKEVVDLLWEELKKRESFWPQIMISSFNPFAMRRAGKLMTKHFPLGIIYEGENIPIVCRRGQGRLIFPCSFLKPKWNIAKREKEDKPGWTICPWTVDTEEGIKAMLELSVPLIITNNPSLAIRTLQEENRR